MNGHPAVAISLTEQTDRAHRIVHRYITVTTGPGHAALFILEDPQPNTNADAASLDSIPTLR